MRRATLAMLALAAVLPAQDLTGTWQGTLPAGRELRIVVKISKADAGKWKAVLYSIDQGGQGIGATAAVLQGSTVKLTFAGIGGSYEGKLGEDGGTIAGTWKQGDKPLALNLARVTEAAAWPIPEPPAALKPMRADANPAFEVATIKPSKPDAVGKAFQVRGRHFGTFNTSLADMLLFAYGLHPKQISGGPSWVETDKFDISAQPDGEGAPNDKQWKAMMAKLVADRFKLVSHREKKELPVYAITVAKGGHKLNKSDGDPNGLPGLFFRKLGMMPAQNATIADLAGTLQAVVLDRPVVDQTGLTGRWDFTLSWTPDQFQFTGLGVRPPAAPSDDANAPPDLFTAFQQQLGLKLESTKAPVEILVVDKVEKPSEN